MSDAKSPADSAVETRYLVMPQHANLRGTLFGGQLMSWIDTTAAMVAIKHSGRICVTASVDRIVFLAPIQVGDQVVLKASCNYVGRSSMEIGVAVFVEHPTTGEVQQATTAYLTFVMLDDDNRPAPAPALKLVSEDDHRRNENGRIRVEHRKQLLNKLRPGD